ncbi:MULTISPECIES: rod-binding protein [Campylobacter]|uniref:rod-binding protein n=1 Tax=Campylobacter TaxID=194 RepID=UPI00147084A8|nr:MULTISPECIES: rod-binding protein [Campylobacter]MBN7288454.1 rod-binding protein [Campylobacter curvus]MDU6827339.1 rod-binding protein [Campylobacter sp.]
MQIDNQMALNSYNALGTDVITKKQNFNKTQQDKLLKEQTDAFEAFMIKAVLDIALKDDDKNSLFPKAAGEDIYRSMYNDTMSRALSGGLGFSQLLYDFLKRDS